MQTIYGVIRDLGNGSAYMYWYRDPDDAEKVLNLDDAFMNEGQAKILIFPDDLDLDACGFRFSHWHDSVKELDEFLDVLDESEQKQFYTDCKYN